MTRNNMFMHIQINLNSIFYKHLYISYYFLLFAWNYFLSLGFIEYNFPWLHFSFFLHVSICVIIMTHNKFILLNIRYLYRVKFYGLIVSRSFHYPLKISSRSKYHIHVLRGEYKTVCKVCFRKSLEIFFRVQDQEKNESIFIFTAFSS